jgi:outer membrane protein TolC
MRRKTLAALLVAFAIVAGCKYPCFMTEEDYHSCCGIQLPPGGEVGGDTILPPSAQGPSPASVSDPQRQDRYLSLREAIAVALENGTAGRQNLSQPPGRPNEGEVTLAAAGLSSLTAAGTGAVGPSDSVRVLALAPAVAGTEVEAALSRFDALWHTSLTWTRTDQPLGAPLPTSLSTTGFPGGTSVTGVVPPIIVPTELGVPNEVLHADVVRFDTGIYKPLPTGGVAGITFMTEYERTNTEFLTGTGTTPGTAAINPAYIPQLQFSFQQPLLQGFGVCINQLLPEHPSSAFLPFVSAVRPPAEGILLARVRLDQQRAEFERIVNYVLYNVEAAYWNLYGAYYQLYSRETGMRVALEIWRINQSRYNQKTIDLRELKLAERTYELFRGERLAALGQVLEAERRLRALMGLPTEDGTRLIPSDTPTLAPWRPDWTVSLDEALRLRPELVLERQELKLRQLDLIRLKNELLPDLRFIASYNIHALGGSIDGGESPSNAFHQLVSDPFGTSNLGLVFNVPIGMRAAHAGVRAAQLALAQAGASLRDEEGKVERYLALQYRNILEYQQQTVIQQALREATTEELQVRYRQFILGRERLDLLLTTERAWAEALASEYQAITGYQNALVGFEFARGTILRFDKVVIADGALPACAQVRAVEHERELTRSLVLHERAGAAAKAGAVPDGELPLPHLPTGTAAPLPAVLPSEPQERTAPAEEPVPLPAPRPLDDKQPGPAVQSDLPVGDPYRPVRQ